MTYKPHPLRVQRKRTKGFRLPEGAVCVTRPGKYGNPFNTALAFAEWVRTGSLALSEIRDASLFPWAPASVAAMREARDVLLKNLAELKGRQLACFCQLDVPCHADVLAYAANESRYEFELFVRSLRDEWEEKDEWGDW